MLHRVLELAVIGLRRADRSQIVGRIAFRVSSARSIGLSLSKLAVAQLPLAQLTG